MLRTRRLTALWIVLFAGVALTAAPQSNQHSGTVLESMNSGGYSYISVQEGDETFWIAAPQTALNKGDSVSFDEQMWMTDFTSKTLKRTFDRIMFVGGVQVGGVSDAPAPASILLLPKPLVTSEAAQQNVEDAGLLTVADLYLQKDKLNGKLVSVKGKVIKVSAGIMGKNWIHVSDGTVTDEAASIIFTSGDGIATVGDEVTATGILEINLDLGSGYFYDVIVQSSSFKK